MIQFKHVKYRNFLSTGNAFTEIQLNRSQTTLLTAKNGGGKSTVIDAIVFALYGTPFRKINKPSLVNSINKRDLLVEIEFSISNNDYRVVRGIKPNVFEVYKNGSLINQAADVREYQNHLETNILKMNKSSFCQIVVLGSATYVPFMVLTPHQRREIIEDLLDIKVFSTMNSLLKQKVSANKEATSEARYNIDLIKDRIEVQRDMINRMSQDHAGKVEKLEERIASAKHSCEEITKNRDELNALIDEALSRVSDKEKKDTRKKIDQLNIIREKWNDKAHSVKKQITFFQENDVCSTCTQHITDEFKSSIIAEKQESFEEIQRAFPEIESKYQQLTERYAEIDALLREVQALRVKVASAESALEVETRVIRDLEKELIKVQSESGQSIDRSKLRELTGELQKAEQNLETHLRENIVLTAASALLKDGGIKAKIIKQYIPIMNKMINKYLAQMDFFVQFELDENFNETIKSRFRDDFSYQNFSEGEKLRIDLAILFAWRAIAKMRNSAATNLLIMDEVLDGALDANGMDEFLTIIQEANKDSNVFVISHRGDQLFDKFHSVIKFEKQGNFSRIV